MLVTKREVKQTSKKLLSVLLAVIMMMTSMSVCFGSFVPTASAADDAIGALADILKNSAYSNTISQLANSKDTGSGVARKLDITFSSYINYKQAAEILRAVDTAMKASETWKKVLKYDNDQQSACEGRTTQDVYNEFIKELAKKGVGTDEGTDVQKALRRILTWDNAKLHSNAVKSSSQPTWTNTITFSTNDYKGYLAQVGKAANVISPVELGVKYTITMPGNLYYGVAGSCGSTTKYYHNMFWPKDAAVNAPASNATNTEMKSKVDEHISKLNTYINMSYASMLGMSASALDATVTELNKAISNHVAYVGSQATYDALYADYAAGIANFRSSVQSAKDFTNYMPTVDNWNAFVAANPNYGVFRYDDFGPKGSEGHAKLLADFATFKAYRDYLLTGGSIYQYLLDNNYIDEAYYTNFLDNVVAYDLQDSKNAADALYAQYSAVNPGMDETELSLEEKTIAYNQFCGFVNNIGNYSAQVVDAVYDQGYQYLIDMREYFKCEINEAVLYFAENAYKSFATVNTTNIISEIDTAKGHEANLTALYNEVVVNAGTDKANQLLATLRTAASAMIEGMYQTLAERFTAQVNEADKVYTELSRPSKLDMVTYLKLSTPILALEDGWDKNYHPENYDDNADNNYNRGDNGIIGIQDVLDAAGKGSLISNATRTTWNNFINAIYETWLKYGITYGFADYVQSQIQYADRTVMEGDELKTAADPVTEAEMLKLVEALDKIITSDTVGGILGGLLGAEAGEGFDLGAMLTDLIKGALFTDDFINTVVQMLYPLVVTEFDKVWAGLPTSITYSGIDVTVRYKKTLNNILEEGKFEIFPNLLAKKLTSINSTKYADNIAMLNAAGGESDAWESPKLVDYDTGKLKLTWGVAEQKEKLDAGEITQAQFDKYFYDTFEDAASGLLPLLTTLITNKAWTPAQCDYIATGQAAIVTLNVDVELGSTANSGYANLLVPIYELLGVPYTAVSTIESSTYNQDISYVLEQILDPIFTFLGKLGDAPVATILEILPDLVYALTFRMVKPLLNMLKTTITYDVDTNVISNVLNGGALIEVGNMLITDADDAVLPNSAFTNGINSLLAFFGLNIPAIDQNTIATLGQLTTMSTTRKAWIYDNSKNGSGKAYTIKADKADVGYFLLNYILNIVKNPDSLSQILGLFMTQKDEAGNPIKDADGKSIPDTEAIAKLQETMYADDGLNLDEINIGNAIAAIVELANQPEYIIDAYNWYEGEYSSPAGESVAMDIYLNPNNDWTKEKAQYLYDNLESLLTTIFTMANLDLDSKTEGVQNNIEELLGGLINGLFTNETVTSLAKLLGSLSDLGALLAPKAEGEDTPEASEPEVVAEEGEEATEEAAGLDIAEILTDLLKNELGIDLSVYAQYANIAEGEVVDFGVTDAETFVAALTELLKPIKPVVDFILGGKDLTLIDSAITLQGYNGYNNAIIPLLEALGATPAAYTDNADTLALTLNALVGVINKITTNDPEVANDGAIYTIIDMLPGVIYYISSNALSQGIDKLLTPVYAILDTIRPIYNLDIATLLEGIEVDFDKDGVKEPLGLDIKNINWSFIFGLLKDLLGLDLSALQQVIYDVCDDLGVEYTSLSALANSVEKTEGEATVKVAKKGAFNDNFNQADLLTVLLSFVLEWATVPANAAKLDELLGTNGIIASLKTVFADVKIEYGTPEWMYWFDGDEDAFNAYLANPSRINTLAAIDWDNIDTNDWDEDTAKYFAENIDVLVDKIIAMINADKEDAPKTLAALLDGVVNENLGGYFTADTINTLIGYIQNVLANVDDTLLEVGYELLGVNLKALKDYTCTAEINDLRSFVTELARVLDDYAKPVVDLLFFGDDIRIAKKSDSTDTIVINGGKGYEKGLAMVLEALGCELPELVNGKTTATAVLTALVDRVYEILANPVDEILDLLPNLVYFLNANGAGVAVSNLLAPVNALIDKINALGLMDPIDLEALIGIDLANLSLENVVTIVEGATGLKLDAAEAILVDFCTGKITDGTYIYKMEAAREDVITILLVVALELINDAEFAAQLDEMLGTNIIAGLKDIFAETEIIYATPEWNYMDGIVTDAGVIEYVNAVTAYPNDWTEEKAAELTAQLPALVDTVIKMIEINGTKYESLSALLTDVLADANIFSTATLENLLGLIKNLLGNIDAELLKVGCVLDVKLPELMAYEVPADIDTVAEFADTLAFVLSEYAPGVVEWLLLGRDFKLLVKDANGIEEGTEAAGAYITINGAQGYEEGLALLLEALGCENLPATTGETKAIVSGVLTSLAARIDEIIANPVAEVLDLLPNLIYFLDANGVAVVIENTIAALMALIDKLSVFNITLDINSLVDLPALMGIADKYAEGEEKLGLDNLTLTALLKALSLMTGLDFTELENVLVPFALGEAASYTSVSGKTAYKMVYKTEYDKHDMVSVIVSAALRMFVENEENAAKLDEMLGTEIVAKLKDVFADVEIAYTEITWDYDKTGDGDYMLTYPNNWNKDTAKAVTALLKDKEFEALIAGLIDANYDSFSALLNDKVNVFTTANLQAVVDLITNLLAGIDDGLLAAAGLLLDVKVAELKAYKVPEGITTVDAFATELANVLTTYASGVVEWLLLGEDYRFFVKEVENGVPVDFITINGANGYTEGLAVLLEALGVAAPAVIVKDGDVDTTATVEAILAAVAARIDEIFANPVKEVIALLPNLIYFLNTNGVAAVVDNTLAAVYALLDKLTAFGLNVDIKSLVNLKALMGIENTDAKIALDNITIATLLEAVSYMVEDLDLTIVESVLVGFDLGETAAYDTVSTEVGTAKKMTLADYDTVTVIANLLLLTVKDADNEAFLTGLVGEEIYDMIMGLFDMKNIEYQNFTWMYTSEETGGNRVGETFSTLETSDLYEDWPLYGPFYTEEMATYIADNFGEFVDNILYLLGLEINGVQINTLTQLINELLDGSLYNSSNVVAIRDALAGVLASVSGLEVNGKNVGKHIVAVLKAAGVADLEAVGKVEVPEFEKDKEQFVASLCDVLDPLYGALKWLLANEEISFFVDTDGSDLITLVGGEGYKYGIIPLLEVLGCENIMTPDAYYNAVKADGDVLLTSILDPLLARVDKIIENPANEILGILPNVFYFINSNGLDTVVKNTLNAVYSLLKVIEPIAVIDLYALIGIDLKTINMNWLVYKLLGILADADYDFDLKDIDPIAELTVGTLEKYDSLSTLEAYRMVYTPDGGIEGGKKELVTVILRLLVTFLMHEKNAEIVVEFLSDNLGMSPDAKTYLTRLINSIAKVPTTTYLGMDQALAVIYYLFYSADIGAGEIVGGFKDIGAEWKIVLKELGKSDDPNEQTIGNILAGLFEEDIVDENRFAPSGLIGFFKKLVDWFNMIIEWFKNLF